MRDEIEKPDILISMDPSFRGLGLSLYAQESLCFTKLFCKRKIKTFQDAYFGAEEIIPQIERIVNHFDKLGTKKKKSKEFVFEIPPTGCSFSPGLFMLDGFILNAMLKHGFNSYGVSCRLCRSVVGIPKVDKKLIMPDFVNSYIPNLKNMSVGNLKIKESFFPLELDMLDVTKDKITSHDIAESLIIMFTYSYIRGWGEKVFPNFNKFCSKPLDKVNLFKME